MWQLQYVSGNSTNIKPLKVRTALEALDAFIDELPLARKTGSLLQLISDTNKPICEQDFRKKDPVEYTQQDLF